MGISFFFRQLAHFSRPLTEGEVTLARSMFKDTIDYASVRLHKTDRLLAAWQGGMAPDNNIFIRSENYSGDFSTENAWEQSFFIHEMTHVWQAQNGRNPVRGCLAIYMNLRSYQWDYRNAYDVPYPWISEEDMPDRSFFDGLNIEQQARLIEHNFLCRKLAAQVSAEDTGPDAERVRQSAEYHRDLARHVFPESLIPLEHVA